MTRAEQMEEGLSLLKTQAMWFSVNLPAFSQDWKEFIILVGKPTVRQLQFFPQTARNVRIWAAKGNTSFRFGGSIEKDGKWRDWSPSYLKQTGARPLPESWKTMLIPIIKELPSDLLAGAFPKWEQDWNTWLRDVQFLNIVSYNK